VQTCSEWMTGANPNRQRLIRHALRSLVKEGHPDALKILGFSAPLCLKISESKISPAKPSIGASLTVEFVVANSSSQTQAVLIDLKVHYMKANGKLAPKVFKVAQFELAAGCNKSIVYRLSLRQMTTRTHFVGEHRVGVLLNGNLHQLGEFFLQA
jgi:hypothetical protein